jgi:uncharacterized protein
MNRQLKLAIEKFNSREFFECHDILEDYWFECRPEEKNFYQGLLHYAVAFHHLVDKKNPAGAKLQFKKCIERLSDYENNYKEIDLYDILKLAEKNLNMLNSNKHPEIKHSKIKIKKLPNS